jgi:RNA-directed DNA polymerase
MAWLTTVERILVKSDLRTMCSTIFNCSFDDVSDLIYPSVSYKSFLISKKSGGERVISEPCKRVMELQRKLLLYLYKEIDRPKACVHGFTAGKSIVTNATVHCDTKPGFVLNVDLADFFPSISFFRVRGVFRNGPFHFCYENATVLAQLCCFNGSLPQGAPTSPLIANLTCRSLDAQLIKVAVANKAKYTRYCDDITFSIGTKSYGSLPSALCEFDGETLNLGKALRVAIEENNFRINESKVRLRHRTQRLEVTGLTINEFPNVKRKYVDEIRGALHAWGKFGFDSANEEWQNKNYLRQTRSGDRPSLDRFIFGKLLHLKNVRGANDFLYRRLAFKFNHLSRSSERASHLPVSKQVMYKSEIHDAVFVIECSGTCAITGEAFFSQGSAFFVSSTELITCEHVLRYVRTAKVGGVLDSSSDIVPYIDNLENSELKVIHPLSGEERFFRICGRDSGRDLALLQVLGDEFNDQKYFLPLKSQANKGDQAFLVGFPGWAPSKKSVNEHETAVTNVFVRSAIQRIEISELIRTGISGGPLLDQNCNLIGIAQQGATQQTGGNECVCVTVLMSWIEKFRNPGTRETKKLTT